MGTARYFVVVIAAVLLYSGLSYLCLSSRGRTEGEEGSFLVPGSLVGGAVAWPIGEAGSARSPGILSSLRQGMLPVAVRGWFLCSTTPYRASDRQFLSTGDGRWHVFDTPVRRSTMA